MEASRRRRFVGLSTIFLAVALASNGAGLRISNPDFVYLTELDENSEDGACRFRGNQSQGVCLPSDQCPGVVTDYQVHRVEPTRCGFDGATPIVCCAQRKKTAPLLVPSRISAKECISFRAIPKKRINPGGFHIAVAGGEETAPAEFPHMVAIGWTEDDTVSWRCGGTLISADFVLTAAHCVVRPVAPNVVRIGEKTLLSTTNGELKIDRIIVHPSYQTSSSYDDIALIKLLFGVLLSPIYRPACLWQTHDLGELQQDLVLATGYGLTEFGGKPSDGLLKVNLTLVDNAECGPMYPAVRKIANGLQDSQLCAGDAEGVKDTCQGDSGGPLQVRRSVDAALMEYHVIGITSFGRGCASRTPGVYTRVSFYLEWIEQIVWPQTT